MFRNFGSEAEQTATKEHQAMSVDIGLTTS